MLNSFLRGRKPMFVAGFFWVMLCALLKLGWLASPEQMPLVSRLNHLIYDFRFSLLPPQRQASLPIVIVDLDERSIQQEGRWPWPRSKMASLLQQLQQHQAGLIGLDMAFSEASQNPVQLVLEQGRLDQHSRQQLSRQQEQFDQDAIFAASLQGNTVLGYFLHNDGQSSGQLPFPFYQLDANEQNNRLLKLDNYSSNIAVLANHALEQGFVVTRADMDGVIRRLPLVIQHKDSLYAGLSLVMAQLALGEPWLRLHLADNGHQLVATELSIGNALTVPLAGDGSILIPFRGGAGSYPSISATSIMRGELSQQQQQLLNGALVLIGTSAMGLSDLRTMVLQTNYPGVEVHANVLDTLLQAALGANVFYHEPDWSPAASLLLLIFSGLLLALLLPGRNPLTMLLIAITGLALVVGLNFYLWQVQHLALPLALQLLCVLALALGNLIAGFLQTSKHKKQMQDLFGSYVPAAYVERLLDDPKAAASMEGEQREMTVLFADIMGFTPLSEALSTSGLKQLLNHYLTEVTRVIFDHQGTIDKYVGDMVMAFWNAPLDDPMHAQNGVLAALDMQTETARLREKYLAEGLPPLRIGIGLNTGPMNVGDMGSHYRRAYTVLGDAVNLGSRLESITRFYGAQILVSDSTQSLCPDVLFMPVDRIQVKGKTEPVDVFEPLCRRSQASAQLKAEVQEFAAALDCYRQQRFSQALTQITRLLNQTDSFKPLYELYIQRCHGFIAQPPPPHWQAVHVHDSK